MLACLKKMSHTFWNTSNHFTVELNVGIISIYGIYYVNLGRTFSFWKTLYPGIEPVCFIVYHLAGEMFGCKTPPG